MPKVKNSGRKVKGLTNLKESTRDIIIKLNKEKNLTQKEIRDITGIPERTQRRIISDPKHKVKIFTSRKADKVGQVKDILGIDILKVKEKYEIADLVQKKTESRYFEQYRVKKVKKITKAVDKDYFEIPLTTTEFNRLTLPELKKLVGKDIFYVRVYGEHKIAGSKHGKTAFQYSSRGFKNPDGQDLDDMKTYLSEMRNTSNDKYKNSEVLGVSITTVEFKASKRGKK